MTYGLLSGAFRPVEQVCVLRALWRQRGMLLRSQARDVQHMQKALTQMNVQLTNVISDVVGETGQKILRAIVAGERDGQVLAALKNVRIRASADEIAKSLQGNWRAEHLFALKQALDAFDFIGKQLAECDSQIQAQLQSLQAHDGEPAKGKKRSPCRQDDRSIQRVLSGRIFRDSGFISCFALFFTPSTVEFSGGQTAELADRPLERIVGRDARKGR